MEAILRDLRYSLRRLLRAPGFAAVAILTLALGIGATTAIFTIVDSVLLTPLPFAEPQRLTMIQNTAGARLSPAYLHDWRLQNRTFDDIAGWRDVRANLTGRGEPTEVLADSATTNFFAVLGVPALLGRTFTTDTDLSRAEPEVVLSYGLWQRRYGGDRSVVGQPITLDGEVYTIVGVMPAGFTIRTNELAESRAELWIPLPLVPDDWIGMGGVLNVVARLRPYVSGDQAQADLTLIARRIEEEHPSYVEDQKLSWVGVVGGEYFAAMGIPLLRGRLPTGADTEASEPVFVIDEKLARLYWPDADPIGTHITWHGGPNGTLSGQIVGVVGNVRWQAMAADPPASAYWWFPHAPNRDLTMVVRTRAEPAGMAALISAQVREIDPNQPVSQIRTMEDFVSADLARPRVTMLLLGSVAVTALLLAAIGLYGVIAFAVTQRTREIGVRVALGAQYRDVFLLVMQRGLVLIGAGLAIGMGVALALGRVVAGLLYGITPSDPVTLLAAAVFLTVVAMAATYFPARRATLVDPLVALRAE